MTVMNVPVVIAAACSCLGDMIVILTLFTVPAGTSLNFSVRYVAYLSMANLLSSAIGLYNNSGAALPRPPICAALGMLEWWSTWSTWLWTAAIAHAFHKAFRERSLEVSIRTERCNHLICWFVPAVLLLVAIFTGSEFGGDGEPGEDICGWMFPTQNVTRARRAEIDIASDVLIDGVQLTVLLFNVWEFICVDLLLRRTAALAGIGTGGVGGAREAGSVALLELPPPPVARRPNLWPTFAGCAPRAPLEPARGRASGHTVDPGTAGRQTPSKPPFASHPCVCARARWQTSWRLWSRSRRAPCGTSSPTSTRRRRRPSRGCRCSSRC